MKAFLSSKTVYVHAIGLAAPGWPDWPTARAVLRGEQAYLANELPVYQPDLLPPNERRRASPTVRMAFRVAEEATRANRERSAELATVFSSADGDLQISNRICTALATPQRLISPTDFHNSVHNAAAGYWSIAAGARGPSTAISAWDGGFGVALLEAAGTVLIEERDTLLVAYDVPAPQPLQTKRPCTHPFGVALWLSASESAGVLAALRMEVADERETTLDDAALEALRLGNPAGRALPLLRVIARGERATISLPLPRDSLRVSVAPIESCIRSRDATSNEDSRSLSGLVLSGNEDSRSLGGLVLSGVEVAKANALRTEEEPFGSTHGTDPRPSTHARPAE